MGIQLGVITVPLKGFPKPVRLNLWDFGGQDIYHGSHALFLHGQAIFLLLSPFVSPSIPTAQKITKHRNENDRAHDHVFPVT